MRWNGSRWRRLRAGLPVEPGGGHACRVDPTGEEVDRTCQFTLGTSQRGELSLYRGEVDVTAA
jgi:hypothetical protein